MATRAQAALNPSLSSTSATRIPPASMDSSRGTNQNKLVRKDSLCHDCTSDCPLYSKGRQQKVTKGAESDDSWSPARVSRTVSFDTFSTRGKSGIVTF